MFYAAGESLVRQGESGDSLYVIQQGCVEVIVASAGGQAATMARLGRGDFFGEMSLLTGEARGATVRALEDTSVLVIRKEHLSPLLEENPAIAESLSRAMELRQRENVAKLACFEEEDEPDHQEASFGLILKRVKSFFGLV
ncbi:cyclic nucleotide-binding domain-containing protein [Candidatus Fermentibacteria bacterium]|nr:cyclic nucleotide-binding domain-containing protein [Candidatus Fermentibacteria bacterium]